MASDFPARGKDHRRDRDRTNRDRTNRDRPTMDARDVEIWMQSEACDMLARAERLHRQFFQLQRSRHEPAWEPPADVLETEREVVVLLALPGVDPERIQAAIEGSELVVIGTRTLPPELSEALIHRVELPQ